MVGRYQTYPEYENSGVEWLGMIPCNWIITRVKFYSTLNPSKTLVRDIPADTEVTFLPMEAIGEKGELNTSNVKSLKDVINGYTYIGEGDVCIAKITPCFENGKGAIANGLKNNIAFATTEVIPFRCYQKEDSRFLYYLLTSSPFNKKAEGSMYGAGGQKRVSDNFVANYQFSLPSFAERQQIADFLDYETAKIDTLIEKQQQLIQLLKEKRQAVISHAVTKGLNPDAPMRDSGIEWLGEVPEHWNVCRVKQASIFITSGPRGWSDYLSEVGEHIFLQSGDLDDKLGIKLNTANRVSPPMNAEGVRTKLESGDVVICITGAKTGRVAIVPELKEIVYINQHLCIVRPSLSRVNSDYLGIVLSSNYAKSYFSFTQYGLKEGLSLTNVAEVPLCLPPLAEQLEIYKHIHGISCILDQLENIANSQIDLLLERRTALISAAVTGKIDVRNWRPPDKDQTNEGEEGRYPITQTIA